VTPEALPTTVSFSMQSRATRFVLRIETGERKGEQVPLGEGTLSVGRRPDAGLSLADGSVSGKHAELRVAGARLEVVDLGSTNGTRVGGAKIESALLSHGDALQFGNVRLTVHDVEFAGGDGPALEEPVLEGGPPASASGDGGNMLSVTSDMVARSKKGSKLLPIVAGVLVLGAGGAFAYVKFLRPSGGGGAAQVSVPSVPGNLLADASFEDGGAEWTSADTAPAAFLRERAGARSGTMGLACALEAGGWSLARSSEFTLAARRSFAFGAALAAADGARARLGVELTSSSGNLPAHTAWLPAGTGGDVRAEFDVPGGYDRGRLVVAALGPGRVTIDDVLALEAEARGGAAKFNEYELRVLGSPGSSAVLVRSGETLIAGFDLSHWKRTGLAGWAEAELAASATENGLRLAFPGAPVAAELAFDVPRAAAQGSGWLATLGPDGYAAHGADFERANVTSVLLGSDLELVRLSFAKPVTVRSASAEGTVSFRIALGGLDACDVQLSFAQERAEAATLARRGAEAEKQGDRGAALSIWSELLDRFPFEKTLVAQASTARARLVASGMAEVDAIKKELERARFFLLPELFQKVRTHALELARAYAGSDVEGEARRAAEESFMALSELTAGKAGGEAQVLSGVLEALDPGAAPKLRAHVEQSLKARAEARKE
jgi:hypothetical protein